MGAALLLLLCPPSWANDLRVGPSRPYTTIREALLDAANGDRILLDPVAHDTDAFSIDGMQIEIIGDAYATTTLVSDLLDGSDTMMRLSNGAQLTLKYVTIQANGEQAFYVEDSTLNTYSVNVHDAFATDGGALNAVRSTIDVYGGTWEDNVAASKGGDVYVVDSTATFDKMTLRRGAAPLGGSFYANRGTTEIVGLTIDGATADTGAALFAVQGAVNIPWSAVKNCVATAGPVIRATGELDLHFTRLEANTATASIVESTGTRLGIDGTRLVYNTPATEVVHTDAATSVVQGNLFCGNVATSGMIKFTGSSVGTFRNNIVMNNTSSQWGVRANGSSLTADNNHFLANTVEAGVGSALGVDGGSLTARNNLVAWSAEPLTGSMSFDYGLFYANSPDGILSGANSIAGDPAFPRPASDSCTVKPTLPPDDSIVVDAGDPSIFDVDGSRSDIGAFGGAEPNDLVEWDDQDGDGFDEDEDCDDLDPNVNPGTTELLCDRIDNDCDPNTVDGPDRDGDGVSTCEDCDDNDPTQAEGIMAYVDGDGDGVGAGPFATTCAGRSVAMVGGDCNDDDPSIFPGAVDLRDDGVDQDCDGADVQTRLDGATGWACSSHGGAPLGVGTLAFGLTLLRRRSARAR